MWRRTLAMVRDHPWIGVGPGNWPVMFPAYAEPDAARDGVLSATLAPRQAHDDLLERAAETGVPGVLALLVLAIGVAVATRRRLQTHDRQKRTLVAGVAGALVALAAISLASFPLEMPGTIALAGLALGFVATDERRLSSPTPRGAAVPALAAALMLVSCALVRAEQGVRSSLAFGVAERALHRDHGAVGGREAIAALERSLDVTPRAFGPELREAQMWLRLGRPMESTLASMRALAVEPNSPNAWATLAAGYLASDDSPGAVTAASQALGRLRDYPLALDVRARAEEKLGKIGDAALDRDRLRDLATTATDEDTRHRARELLEER
jgi:tetratricopeptide (TPR) repeat protein